MPAPTLRAALQPNGLFEYYVVHMPTRCTVQPGDCISSLAESNGLLWEKIWNHPENAQLKRQRKDPNILFPGDVVFLPDPQLRTESKATDQLHKFVLKRVMAKLRIRIMKPPDNNETARRGTAGEQGAQHFEACDPQTEPDQKEIPRAHSPYILDIDGVIRKGQTDSDGYIDVPISPAAEEGTLKLDPGTTQETVIPLQLGYLDPLEEISGVRQRLSNLGFSCEDSSDELTDDLEAALRAYQQSRGLEVTGKPDESTLNDLKSAHGS